MTMGIDIHDSKNGLLTVTLRDVLDLLGESVQGWCWTLHYLWAVGSLPGPRTILELEDVANNSLTGVPVSWLEINTLADSLHQIIDVVLVANLKPKTGSLASKDEGFYEHNDLVIEANDSSYWRVVTKDPDLFKRFEERFEDVELMSFPSEANGLDDSPGR